jgi:hypothetical protein
MCVEKCGRASTAVMQDIITTVLKEELEGKTYDKVKQYLQPFNEV